MYRSLCALHALEGYAKWCFCCDGMRRPGYCQNHAVFCLERRIQHVLDAVYLEVELAPVPLHAKRKALPARRKARIDSESVASYGKPSEAQHGHQPDPAQRGYMYATVDGHVSFCKVDCSGLVEVFQCEFFLAESRCRKSVHGATQGASLAAAGLVMLKV